MADAVDIHIGENSPEHVAYVLMSRIASSEQLVLTGVGTKPTRDWILSTYAECIKVVRTAYYEKSGR